MVERLGGTFKSKGYNELRDNRINKVKLEKPDAEKIKAAAAKGETIPFGLLPDTDIEKYKSNFKIARKIQTKLKLLFKAYKINCKTNDINVYTSYTEVCFEAKTKEDIASIVKLQPKIAKVAHVNHFNISIRGMILYIELGNLFKSKMSLKTVLSLLQDKQSVRAVAGMRKDGSLVNQDFKTNPSALIVGKKGSGSSTLAILMALSVCYTTSPNDLELVVLNANFEPGLSALTSLPHVSKKACESLSECTNKLLKLQNLVIERTSLLKASGVADINKYNKSKTNPEARLKHVLVVIGNVEGLIKNDLQNNRIITDILINGKNTGVYMLMQTYGVTIDILDKDIYNNISDKYMLKVASQEESRLIFNSNRAFSQLHSGSDCLHFKANNFQQSQRLQICDINYDELVFDIDIINTFYNARITSKIVSR
ncbi:MAG: hypothetical protein MJ223_01275 [Mycoplasmoidaceae bacterium]|nr:hypothetical protein [Mycoplasmoidaceae bacterium]